MLQCDRYDVSHLLELLDLALSVVLVLLMRLTLPSGYAIDAEEFEGMSRNLDLSSIGDKFGRGSPETYVVFESVDELFGELHRIDVDHISVHINENLATSATIVDGRCVTVEFVSSNWFSPLDYIQNRILQESSGSNTGELRSVLESFLDDVRGNPTEEGLQFVEIRIASQRCSRLRSSSDLVLMCIVEDIDIRSGRIKM